MKLKGNTLNIAYCAIFAVIIAICSWISIPTVVPFTLQTFAIFFTVGMLGGKRGTISVFIYILLGIIGIPVFSGFSSGIGVILGSTGGYIIGFLFSSILMWIMEVTLGKKTWVLCLSMILGDILNFIFGTWWFMAVYTKSTGPISLISALSLCVFPFIIPDIIKIILAVVLTKRLSKFITN